MTEQPKPLQLTRALQRTYWRLEMSNRKHGVEQLTPKDYEFQNALHAVKRGWRKHPGESDRLMWLLRARSPKVASTKAVLISMAYFPGVQFKDLYRTLPEAD